MRTGFICLCFLVFPGISPAQPAASPDSAATMRALAEVFYRVKVPGAFWCRPGDMAVELRGALRQAFGTIECEGVSTSQDVTAILAMGEKAIREGQDLEEWDRTYTEAALFLGWNYFRGQGAERLLGYDGISRYYNAQDEQWVAGGLSRVRTGEDLERWLWKLLPASPAYSLLRDSLAACLDDRQYKQADRVARAMNTYRWVHHFPFERFIVINIPSADLRYYVDDTLRMTMKVVLGQPSKRTPRFAGWCGDLVLYPYWNVPRRIAISELLPLLKATPGVAALMQYEIIDSSGRQVDPARVDWTSLTVANFPYRIRQNPGCWNALGVLKFDLSDPFDVYMHDTNLKQVFNNAYRYYSHGCIRLEHPLALGLSLLDGKLDTAYLNSCYRDQRPVEVSLPRPVPVFVLYNTVGIDADGGLSWYKDIYGLGL
jgi:murein L,D-transpeptidase YcbB/YkuD